MIANMRYYTQTFLSSAYPLLIITLCIFQCSYGIKDQYLQGSYLIAIHPFRVYSRDFAAIEIEWKCNLVRKAGLIFILNIDNNIQM